MCAGLRGPVLCRAGIERLIAHRSPILYLESVISQVIGVNLIATSTHSSVPPALGLLEALGQASALLIAQTPRYKGKGLPVFASMKNVHWPDIPPSVNEKHNGLVRMRYEVSFIRQSARFGRVNARALAHEHAVVCTGELGFSFLRKKETREEVSQQRQNSKDSE